MKKFKYLYVLQHIHEIGEYDEELNIKRLGVFTSKKEIYKAIKMYKELPGFKDKRKVFLGSDYKEGFYIARALVGISYWDGGFTTVAEIMSGYGTVIYEEPKEEFLELTLSLPSWFKDSPMHAGENSNDFAERIMWQKYNAHEYPRGPESEFYQIKKFKEV